MIEETEDGIIISSEELVTEAVKRVVAGMLKAARAYVPTRENIEGKKEHVDVSMHAGKIYLNTDHSIYAAVITPRLNDFCKKKSALRDSLLVHMHRIHACLNYSRMSPWIKAHEKNVRTVIFGEQVSRLVIVPDKVELDFSATLQSTQYALEVIQLIQERVLEENLIAGPFDLPAVPSGGVTISIDANGVQLAESLVINDDSKTQLRVTSSQLPKIDAKISVYNDPLSGRIVKIESDTDTIFVQQFFRVLVV